VALKVGLKSGHVWVADDVSAVAIWFPPGRTVISTSQMLGAGMWRLPLKAGLRGSARVMGAMSATEHFHKSLGGPHWYLLGLGTLPQRQGSGLGSALLEMGTSRADAAGIPCYLETATDANIEWYGKRGFEVIGETTVHGHRLRGMVRPARVTEPPPSVDAELVEA
jgi:ribosomal protein S18 acetylase RimI-like enzyme